LVDKDGVRENTEQIVDLSQKGVAHQLGFKILSDTEFKEVMMHLKAEFFNAWPREWTTVGLAHTLTPPIAKTLNFLEKHTLFFEGTTGAGKTELHKALQKFWGDFTQIVDMKSSAKGAIDVAYDFKDCTLIIDDYKGTSQSQIETLQDLIQYGYNSSVSIKLQRDGRQRTPKGSRCFVIASGEQFLFSEASAVARTILIEVEKQNTRATRENYIKCVSLSQNYCGITPRFIHWFLNQDAEAIKLQYRKIKELMMETSFDRQNAERITNNLSLNHVVWRLWVEFMYHNEFLTSKEREDLITEHWGYVDEIRQSMLNRCEEEHYGATFVTILQQLISSKEVAILGLDETISDRKPAIGFKKNEKGEKDNICYLHPEKTCMAVANFMKERNFRISTRAISRYLFDLKVIVSRENGRYTKRVKNSYMATRVWVVNLARLGYISQPDLKIVPNIQLPRETIAKQDEYGIY